MVIIARARTQARPTPCRHTFLPSPGFGSVLLPPRPLRPPTRPLVHSCGRPRPYNELTTPPIVLRPSRRIYRWLNAFPVNKPRRVRIPGARFNAQLALIAILAAVVLACLASAATPEVPPGGRSIARESDFKPQGAEGLYRFSRLPQSSGGDVLEIATLRDASPAWAVELIAPNTAPVAARDVALLRFRARATHTTHETGEAQLRAVVQNKGGGYSRSTSAQFAITRDWQEYFLPFRFAKDYATGETGVFFGFGYVEQTVELADVEWLHFGKAVSVEALPRTQINYQGRHPDAPWRREALARIERHRKGDIALVVTDAAGRPVSDAEVSIEMTRHAYEFGTAIPFSLLMGNGPNTAPYREKLLDLFNAASAENDLKWPWWAGDRGKPEDRDRTFAALRWLQEHDFSIRGHVLVWPGWKRLPEHIVCHRGKDSASQIPQLTLDHIADITRATRDYITEWDVVNEPFNNHDLMDLFGNEIMVDWFKTARANLPENVPLYLNDWGNHSLQGDPKHVAHFVATARFLLDNGAPLGGLGLQAHIGGVPTPPESLLATLDHYAEKLDLPVRATEFDFTTEDPQLHAEYTRDFLIAFFSHPSTVGVQFWGFWAGAHWRPDAALFTKDWQERPAGAAVRTLIRDDWWTRATATTDATGTARTRGFYGKYTARITHGSRTSEVSFDHKQGGAPIPVSLKNR